MTLAFEWGTYFYRHPNALIILVHDICYAKWQVSRIPQCTCPISHNTPLCNRDVHIFVTMWCAFWDMRLVHCEICEIGLLVKHRRVNIYEIWSIWPPGTGRFFTVSYTSEFKTSPVSEMTPQYPSLHPLLLPAQQAVLIRLPCRYCSS